MFKSIKTSYSRLGAVMTMGAIAATPTTAEAAATANNFSSIGSNITASVAELPGLISAMSYLFGVLLAVLGVMKIKDHVENPTQTPLKDGAIRLAAGGALFALPIVLEAMTNTVGTGGATTSATLSSVSFVTN